VASVLEEIAEVDEALLYLLLVFAVYLYVGSYSPNQVFHGTSLSSSSAH